MLSAVLDMAKKFDRTLERATAPTLLEPDWEGILTCVDLIRSGEAPVKNAVTSIFKRIHHENPHVASYALLVLECATKNCGEKLHKEVITRENMEELKRCVGDQSVDKTVRDKILELIGIWRHAFRNASEFQIAVDTYNLMKMEG